jgi:LCP family protein required for cell wall assembly
VTVGSTGPHRTHDPTPPDATEGRHRRPGGPSDVADELLAAWAGEDLTAPSPSPSRGDRRWPWRIGVLGVACLIVAATAVGVLHRVSDGLGEQVRRVPDVFGSLDPAARPAAGGTSTTFLLVGTDTWDESRTPDDLSVAPNSDVLMLARLSADRSTAAVASIPRSSWVDIPGHGPGKVSSAYALGGAPLLIRTVENLTQVRVDHFAVLDFSGFRYMVDAVGGVDVEVRAATTSDGLTLHQGLNHLDGRQALAYVRVHGFADGDLERAQRQQAALRALFTQVAARGMLSNPAATYALLDAASKAVSVDDTLSNGGLRAIVSSLDALEPTAVAFVRAPVAALARTGVHPAVYLDAARSAELWRAFRDDRVSAYERAHPDDALGGPR